MGDTGPLPLRAARPRRGAVLRRADRALAGRRGRREAHRRRLQHRVGGRARHPARLVAGARWSVSSTPGCGPLAKATRNRRVGRGGHGGDDPLRRLPARHRGPGRCRSSSCPRRARGSSSSSNGARRARTRWRCWPSGCWRRCATPGSTPCCSGAPTTRSWPGPSPTSWVATWCSCPRPTRPPSRSGPSWATPIRADRRGARRRRARLAPGVLVGRRGVVPDRGQPALRRGAGRGAAARRGPTRPPVADAAGGPSPDGRPRRGVGLRRVLTLTVLGCDGSHQARRRGRQRVPGAVVGVGDLGVDGRRARDLRQPAALHRPARR